MTLKIYLVYVLKLVDRRCFRGQHTLLYSITLNSNERDPLHCQEMDSLQLKEWEEDNNAGTILILFWQSQFLPEYSLSQPELLCFFPSKNKKVVQITF